MISISHSPNSTIRQQKQALGLLFPWNWNKWKQGSHTDDLKTAISNYHDHTSVTLFNNGRSALYAILIAMGVQSGDEVLIQAYTCIVVPNSIIWAGAKPVYIDIDPSYNIDPNLIEEAITPKTKAIIVQHTFGYPAQMDKILEIAKKYDLKVIEDCAHALGAKYKNKPVGTIGDAAILSFGRDKIISSVSGGATLTNNKELAEKIHTLATTSPQVPMKSIFQNLMHPLLIPWMSRLIGPHKIGQILIQLSQRLQLLNKVYAKNECNGERPIEPIQQFPNAMAKLALAQFRSLPQNLKKRSEHAFSYQEFCSQNAIQSQAIHINSEPAYLRFTIEHDDPSTVRKDLLGKGFLLGNWYTTTIMPRPDNWSTIYYNEGSCPNSERLVKRNINLPTQPKFSERSRTQLLRLLKKHYE